MIKKADHKLQIISKTDHLGITTTALGSDQKTSQKLTNNRPDTYPRTHYTIHQGI